MDIVGPVLRGERLPTVEGAMARRDPTEQVPLTPAVFHILLALGDGERHGYAIMLEVARLTEGRTQLGPGTLYRSIQRLLADGLIIESRKRPLPGLEDERRRYYGLTEFGRRVATAEAERLFALVTAARHKGILPAPPTDSLPQDC
jgi:DNA-binding PadR family transcriptional regulator